jgi:ribonuclease T2
MLQRRLRRTAQTVAIAVSFVFVLAVVAFAADAAGAAKNQPGKFDYYVLALSWSPSYCAGLTERGGARRPDPQCGGRPFAFVVHGLWPQYDKGFPSYCTVPAPRIGHAMMSGMLDLMPSPHLIYHEWDRHGTCSGLSAQSYFDLVRKARAAVQVPAAYRDPGEPLTVAPAAVAAAFEAANPGLSAATLAVTCSKTRLSEVRLCLTKDLKFRDCPAVAGHGCKRDKVVMPAVRGE